LAFWKFIEMVSTSYSWQLLLLVVTLGYVSGAANLLVQKKLIAPLNRAIPPSADSAPYSRRAREQQQDTYPVFAQQRNITVQINIFNVGDSSAYDVEINDPWPKAQFHLVSGKTHAKFEEIPAGGSESLNLTVLPSFHGAFSGLPATVTYSVVDDGGKPQLGSSNPIGNISIIDTTTFEKLTAKHIREWLIVAAALFFTILYPLVNLLNLQYSYTDGIPNTPNPNPQPAQRASKQEQNKQS